MLPFLHYCCVCVYVCGIDDVAVVTKCCIFFEGGMCLCMLVALYSKYDS